MLQRLTTRTLRAPRAVMLAWLVLAVLGLVAMGGLFSSLEADLDGAPSAESERVGALLDELDPGGGEVVAVVTGAAVEPAVEPAVVERLESTDGVEAVLQLPSDDGASTAVAVELAGGLGDDAHEDLVEAVAAELRGIDAPEVLVGGELLLDEEVSELAERDAQRAEAIALPVALIALAVLLGSVRAAGLPLAIAVGGVAGAALVVTAAAAVTDISLYAVNTTVMLGLGLGIDYGLLLVARFREERGAGLAVPDAVARTVATAGRTVVFSGCTVAAALLALVVFEDPTIRSLAIAGIAVVLACMAAALTLLPALLVRGGHRLRPAPAAGDHGAFAHLARFVQRRAVPVVVLVGAGLALLAVPFAGARFDDPGALALPRSSETRAVAEAMDERFPAVTAEPVVAVAEIDPDDPAVATWLDHIAARPGVAGVTVDDASRAGTTVVEVAPDGPSNGRVAQDVVGEVRDVRTPFPVLVGGDPAEVVDFRHGVADRLPYAVAVVVVVTFALLFAMTGSVVVPVKAIVMNVLSLGATFGALVWVFQDGHLAGLLGFDPPGSLDVAMPVVVFLFAFGLSMDYEVFLLARIREVWEETGDNDRAVAAGLQRSGRIITSAAVLMVIVFAGFAAGEILPLKQLGLGLLLAVVIDATVVRSLLVPATMKLMGDWNWWSPRPLARLHRHIALREA